MLRNALGVVWGAAGPWISGQPGVGGGRWEPGQAEAASRGDSLPHLASALSRGTECSRLASRTPWAGRGRKAKQRASETIVRKDGVRLPQPHPAPATGTHLMVKPRRRDTGTV